MKLYVYTDGASRGNPGESASGYLILDQTRKLLQKHVFYNGVCTNNVAEYNAVIVALKKSLGIGGSEVTLVSDSKLVINQLAGNYKTKDRRLRALNTAARKLLDAFKKRELLNVPRENRYISMVDMELNRFLDDKAAGQEKV